MPAASVAFVVSFILGVVSVAFAAADLNAYFQALSGSDEYVSNPCVVAGFSLLLLGSLALLLASSVGGVKSFQRKAQSTRRLSIPLVGLAVFALLCSIFYLGLVGGSASADDHYDAYTFYL